MCLATLAPGAGQTVKLNAWATIEGTLREGKKVLPGTKVYASVPDRADERVDIRSEPTWLIDHGPTAWLHGEPAGEIRLRAGSVGSGTLTVTVAARTAADGVVSTCHSLTQHPLVVS